MGEDLFDTKNIYERDVQGIWQSITITTDINKVLMPEICKINKAKVCVPLPTHYIINQGATILFWENGEKTVVKRCADDEFNPRLAFLTAFFQHYCGMSKNKANKYLASLQVEVEPKPKQKPKNMKEETKFKVGDIVEVTEEFDCSKKGWIGKITKVDSQDSIQVKYNDDNEWWIDSGRLKLIKEGK